VLAVVVEVLDHIVVLMLAAHQAVLEAVVTVLVMDLLAEMEQ
jgi:hypothetical protein